MSVTDLDRFTAASVYPGKLDEQAVEGELAAFLQALGLRRRIVRLRARREEDDYPSSEQSIEWISHEWVNPISPNPMSSHALSAPSASFATPGASAPPSSTAISMKLSKPLIRMTHVLAPLTPVMPALLPSRRTAPSPASDCTSTTHSSPVAFEYLRNTFSRGGGFGGIRAVLGGIRVAIYIAKFSVLRGV